ncbi:DUF4706 domain-containing protein [Trichonephila inaurata madagascariensis]|uniref:DUF4706 domain-containing protein n=1 Tax=Trichonephila inaurata madagascariensis TaxID=2747483 RepID=A0A8X6XI49_9ARAC|nr:DUF4706 domain-containing protein [Trichonephila inaurata madagascariensis]
MSNLVREQLENYFSSVNSTSSRMMADITSCRKEYSDEFNTLPDEEQAEILWKSIVKSEAVKKYEDLPPNKIDVEYFPVLRTHPGEKIIVDEDASAGRTFGCSWRDEHSAPFRWETQSQLDLRFDAEDSESEKVTTLEKTPLKPKEPEKTEVKKEEEIKRVPTVKRPEVPPPPVPPHAVPPIPPHADSPTPPPSVTSGTPKNDIPIYAKVVKRKSNAKTLLISEMKAHRKAKEEMKPAVPPRMSLELRGEVDISKYKTLPIDFEGIPKTGFDFLDNW